MSAAKKKSFDSAGLLKELRRIRNLVMLGLKKQGLTLDELSQATGIDKGDISRAISTKKRKKRAP